MMALFTIGRVAAIGVFLVLVFAACRQQGSRSLRP